MLPNTLPLYSGEWASPAGHAKEGDAFRISDDNQRGEFQVVLGGGNRMRVTVQHSVQNGKAPAVSVDRHTIRLESVRTDAESGVEDVASVSLTIAAPRRGFENTEYIGLVNGLLSLLVDPAASQDPLGFGDSSSFPELIVDQLLSGVI